MPRQLTTSLSDFILAISAFYAANALFQNHYKPAVGLLVQGIAASIGVVRFALETPEGTFIFHGHKFCSWIAATFGVPAIALGYCSVYSSGILENKILIFVAIVAISSFFLPLHLRQITSQAVSGFAMVIILILCFMHANWFGVFAGVVYVISGLIGGADGYLGPFLKVDILHYGLVMGNILFMYSFPPVPPPRPVPSYL